MRDPIVVVMGVLVDNGDVIAITAFAAGEVIAVVILAELIVVSVRCSSGLVM